MSEHRKAALHTHVGLPGAFRATRMPQVDRQPSLHGQKGRIPWRDAVT